ncbi:conserved hypothetical protein [Talaromyces stipitatus ATCC 10500]|uniref:Uncharacterized protein n=1 Tax=Talaromyces stipitatus (strain ATCC 10500 / CBS 375.48 / QM 6759 / NRRL 1006) TaxID=441959 RepID=B8ML59_TALSN|nr:uncharacterized protein TSTA_049140 [Talaromyces stipitatus ATCC 10500]EED15474.1 conserved hypothetical protein [Talaromyces stipitatus ATCC 10500]
MSDTEQEWKPNPRRPQSTMAQAFSLALDSAFMLDNEVNDLTQSIELKKQRMTIQTRELEALQARIREAEELLQREQAAKDAAAENGDNTLHGTGSAQQEGRGESDLARALSPTSSTLSDEHQSDEGATDSDTSAATSHDMDDQEDTDKGKPHAS